MDTAAHAQYTSVLLVKGSVNCADKELDKPDIWRQRHALALVLGSLQLIVAGCINEAVNLHRWRSAWRPSSQDW